jgi:hypothetical protein
VQFSRWNMFSVLVWRTSTAEDVPASVGTANYVPWRRQWRSLRGQRHRWRRGQRRRLRNGRDRRRGWRRRAHRDLTTGPGAPCLDRFAGPVVTRVLLLEVRQHMLGAVGSPERQCPVVLFGKPPGVLNLHRDRVCLTPNVSCRGSSMSQTSRTQPPVNCT